MLTSALLHQYRTIFSRFAALSLVALVCIGVWTLLLKPLTSQIEAGDATIEEKRERLARYLAVASGSDEILGALKAIGNKQTGAEAFLAKSEAIAAAALQARVASFAAANRVTLRSARPLQRREEEDAVLIGMRVHLSGELRSMQHILHTIENAIPFMFIEAAQMTGGPNRPPAGQSPELMMDVQLDIYGIFAAEPE